jgi:hypothetical protein
MNKTGYYSNVMSCLLEKNVLPSLPWRDDEDRNQHADHHHHHHHHTQYTQRIGHCFEQSHQHEPDIENGLWLHGRGFWVFAVHRAHKNLGKSRIFCRETDNHNIYSITVIKNNDILYRHLVHSGYLGGMNNNPNQYDFPIGPKRAAYWERSDLRWSS